MSTLQEELIKEKEFLRSLTCVLCGSEVTQIPHPQLFTQGSPLPAWLAKCPICETIFEPYSKIVVKQGHILKNTVESPLFLPPDLSQ